MAYATKWTGEGENQNGRVWRKTRLEELHGIGKPEMSIYQNRCTHTHTQELDTPVPTTGYHSYKALTPPPLGTQGNWKRNKSFYFMSTLCYGSESHLIPHRYVNCSQNIYLATCHSQPRWFLIKAKATQTRATVLHLQLSWIPIAAKSNRTDHP